MRSDALGNKNASGMTSNDSTLVSTQRAAQIAGVAAVTIRQWRYLGRITPADVDDRGHMLYEMSDIVAAEIVTRGRGRPRHTDVAARYSKDVDWPLDAIRHLVARCALVMADVDEDLGLTRLAIARIGVRGDPEGEPVIDLRIWAKQFDDEQLRDKIINAATTEISEREAGALRTRRIRRRNPVSPAKTAGPGVNGITGVAPA